VASTTAVSLTGASLRGLPPSKAKTTERSG
jgi:hypothetical protein